MSTRLEKLTPEQEARIPHYRDMWLRIGLQSGRPLPDTETLRGLLTEVYREGGLAAPQGIITAASPLEGSLMAYVLEQIGEELLVLTGSIPALGERLNQIVSAVLSGGSIVPLISPLPAGVRSKVEMITKSSGSAVLGRAIYGLHDAGWLSYYSFLLGETTIEGPSRLIPLMNLAKAGIGWVWPFEKLAVVTAQPAEVHMQFNKLHRSGGPAITYTDSTLEVYALNGISFSGDMVRYVRDPVESLNPMDVLSIRNVEQRAEIIKRIGITKMFIQLRPELLDTSDGYDLYRIDLEAYTPRIYLKMQNPSVDEIHIEGVHPDCKTVSQALNWRNFGTVSGPFTKPLILT